MATADNFLNSGIQNFATSSNWSTGSVPNSSNDADLALSSGTIVGSSANETVNSIGTSSLDTLDVTCVTFDALNGTGPSQNLGTIFVGAAAFGNANVIFEISTLNINIHNTAPEAIETRRPKQHSSHWRLGQLDRDEVGDFNGDGSKDILWHTGN